MDKKYFILLSLSLMFIVFISNSYALETYLGIEIVELEEGPTLPSDCDSRNTNRGICSVLPDYPIYFNLSYYSNGSVIWQGNSTEDWCFSDGDVMYLPEKINFIDGEKYKLFFDIDVLKLYIENSLNYGDFEKTLDDIYWTIGKVTSSSELYYLGDNDCKVIRGDDYYYALNNVMISNNRTKLNHSCIDDGASKNCHKYGFIKLCKNWT